MKGRPNFRLKTLYFPVSNGLFHLNRRTLYLSVSNEISHLNRSDSTFQIQ